MDREAVLLRRQLEPGSCQIRHALGLGPGGVRPATSGADRLGREAGLQMFLETGYSRHAAVLQAKMIDAEGVSFRLSESTSQDPGRRGTFRTLDS